MFIRSLVLLSTHNLTLGIDKNMVPVAGYFHIKEIIIHDAHHIIFSRDYHVAVQINHATAITDIISPVLGYYKFGVSVFLVDMAAIRIRRVHAAHRERTGQ